jgi:beta-galactosidase
MLRDMGCNAIRSSHNPPAPELLDLCDEMGFLVMDESFDMWRKRKTNHDYSRYFDAWHERDLSDLVQRDRNHPSIVMWSIGNEVLEQWSDAAADTLSLEEANLILNFGHSADQLANDGEMSVNSLLTAKLAGIVHNLDATRPVTAGCNEPDPANHLFKSGAIDVIGYNYHDSWFKDVPENFPGKPFIITESVSALMTRGYYSMPSDSVIICPERWDVPYYNPSFACSSYDNCRTPWGSDHEITLKQVKNNDFISGQFVWTGFDYIGEPTPYGWPARSSYFGIVDLAGFPKDVYYLYQSEWRQDKTVLHIFPHWNWQPGEDVDIWAYYNNADEVELFVNGVSQGVRTKDAERLHVSWRVKYQPGNIRAVSRKNGVQVAEQQINTAGAPAAIRLTPDRTEIAADSSDLAYFTVEIVDADGNVCPLADNEVHFAVSGSGVNVGVDNGSPVSLERFKADKRHAFYGKALLIVQSTRTSGAITVTASADGLSAATSTIQATSRAL